MAPLVIWRDELWQVINQLFLFLLRPVVCNPHYRNLLRLLDRLGHRQEDAVKKDGGHYEVVKELVRCQVHAGTSGGAPRGEAEERFRPGEPVDVVLAEALRHHAEGLKMKRENYEVSTFFQGFTKPMIIW